MKFRFITILHNMELDSLKNRGTEIFPGARISNGKKILDETLNTNLMRGTAGIHSIDEFENKVYFYIDGEFEDINTKDEMDKIGTKYTFFFLRQAQLFIHYLWQIKDNNVYVRDGFLIAYKNHIEDGFTYKASLSEVFSYSTLERKASIFTDEEISSAKKIFVPYTMDNFDEETFGGKYPNSDIFLKTKGSTRMDRAIYFVIGARTSSVFPMKIVHYCTALECLFTIGNQEISHKIAERVAVMLGTSSKDKKELYNVVKTAYSIRSKIVHGQYLKSSDDELASISKELDNILRQLIVRNHEVFSKDDKEAEHFFQDLIFG